MRNRTATPLGLLVLTAVFALSPSGATPSATPEQPPPLTVKQDPLVLQGMETIITVEALSTLPHESIALSLVSPEGEVLSTGLIDTDGVAELRFVPASSSAGEGHPLLSPRYIRGLAIDFWSNLRNSGLQDLVLTSPDMPAMRIQCPVRVIPGWLSLAPPFLAIALALIFRQVVPALLSGIWLGAWITSGNPLVGMLRTLDRYIVGALADADHISIVVFSLLLGGMVGIISRSGGTAGLVDALAGKATSSRNGQLVTWFLGVAVFFDDYANTLVVGNTMRPVTDRLRISREKLAYIVDSTAAPVAAIGIISTWIGYEVSLIGDALEAVGSDLDAYSVFLQSIPYNFYPVLALVFGFLIAWSGRDLGPMRRAEIRAAGGRLIGKGAMPLSDFDSDALAPIPDKPRRWFNSVAPVLSVIAVTFLAQWFTGRGALAAEGEILGSTGFFSLGFRDIGTIFASGNSFHSLLYASATGCIVALVMARAQRILTVAEGLYSWIQGMKSMLMAFVILTLAWSIAGVCSDLHASGFVADALSGAIDPRLLPVLVFLFSAIIAFATGTSWATMGILVPLAVPAAFGVAQAAGFGEGAVHRIFLGTIAAVLAGAIFGDHCSPISDTTVLSSMSSGCDHMDHVRTQLPYALAVAVVAMLVGYIPCAFGLSPWLALIAGVAVLVVLVRFRGKRIPGPKADIK